MFLTENFTLRQVKPDNAFIFLMAFNQSRWRGVFPSLIKLLNCRSNDAFSTAVHVWRWKLAVKKNYYLKFLYFYHIIVIKVLCSSAQMYSLHSKIGILPLNVMIIWNLVKKKFIHSLYPIILKSNDFF